MRCLSWVFAVLAVVLAGVPAVGQPPPIRIDDVHCDLALEYVSGSWRGQLRPDGAGPYNIIPNQPADAQKYYLVANPSTRTTAPGPLPFLGIGAGEAFWHLQASQTPGQLYLGLSAQQMGNPPAGDWANWQPAHVRPNQTLRPSGKWIELQIKDGRGPAGGNFAVWLDSAFGPDVYASTAQFGAQDPRNALYTLVGGHTHYNWAFTQPGLYEVDIDARAFYSTGIELHSNPTGNPLGRYTFTFEVQPVPEPATVLAVAVGGLLVGACVRRARRATRS